MAHAVSIYLTQKHMVYCQAMLLKEKHMHKRRRKNVFIEWMEDQFVVLQSWFLCTFIFLMVGFFYCCMLF